MVLVYLLTSVIILYFLTIFILFRIILHRKNSGAAVQRGSKKENDAKAWLLANNAQTVVIENDGLQLVGSYLSNKADTTVILVHGYHTNRLARVPDAQLYFERGYNVLLIDQRTHGDSQGIYICMGYYEKYDLLKWIGWAEEKAGAGCRIILDGISMGGATVLCVSGNNPPASIKAIISDCAFTSAYEVFAYRLKHKFHFFKFPALPTCNIYCRLFAKYDLKSASPLEAVAQSRVPTLFIHGEKDTFVPYQMVHTLFEACSAKKELVSVPNAIHGTARRQDSRLYEGSIFRFIEEALGNERTI